MLGPPRAKGRLKDELRALKSLAPYLWPRNSFELRVRVVLALVFLLAGKLVNIYVPLALQARRRRSCAEPTPRSPFRSP